MGRELGRELGRDPFRDGDMFGDTTGDEAREFGRVRARPGRLGAMFVLKNAVCAARLKEADRGGSVTELTSLRDRERDRDGLRERDLVGGLGFISSSP